MPFRQLVSAGLETALNQFLLTQVACKEGLSQLRGKRLCVFLDVLDTGFTLVFDDKILLLNGPDCFESAKTLIDGDTCVISTKLSVLGQLKDTSQLTALIQQGDLALVGDIAIAQQVSELLAPERLDFEEALAQYTSDVFAHSSIQLFTALHRRGKKIVEALSVQAAELLLEERPIAARQQGVEGVGQLIDQLRDDSERVRMKLELFEKQRNAANSTL